MATSNTFSAFLSQLLQQLSDDELIASGPDIITFLNFASTSSDPVALLLQVHRLGASLLADQATVRQQLQTSIAGTMSNALTAAIAAAKARQSTGTTTTGTAGAT